MHETQVMKLIRYPKRHKASIERYTATYSDAKSVVYKYVQLKEKTKQTRMDYISQMSIRWYLNLTVLKTFIYTYINV